MLYYYIYITFLIIGIVLSIYLIARLWTIRKTPGAGYLIWTIACVVVWAFAYIFEIASENPASKSIWMKIEYLGIPFVSLAIFSFIIVYTGRSRWLSRKRLYFLLIIPTMSLILAFTNDWHHLLWSTISVPVSLIGPVTVTHGSYYAVNVLYSYGLLIIAFFFLIQVAVRRHNLFRSQAIIMLVGIFIPWVGNLAYIFRPGIDWTPLAFTITAATLMVGLARYGLLDVMPITERLIFNAMRDGIIVTDVQGRVYEINPSAQGIFQKQGGQLIGQSIESILPDWGEWNHETSTAFEIDHEMTIGVGGDKHFFKIRVAPILDNIGRVNGNTIIIADITEQKLAQAQMVLQVTALEAAENGIVITDRDGEIQWANPAFARLTGYSHEEVVGKTPRILKSGKQGSEFYQKLWQTVLTGQVWHGELINRRKDGSEYFEEMTITPLVEPSGVISNFIAIKQDISKRKYAEEQLLRTHEQAVEANRLKTQLLASVSHDLRTPLGTIMGYADMLQAGTLGSVSTEQVNAAAAILDSANRMLSFVNNLIGQAQIETGNIVIRPSTFQPKELMEGVQSLVGLMASKKGLEIKSAIDPEVPNQIISDPYWLKQILLNLVNNAVKFTEKGCIKIRFIRPDEGHWAMQVTDTGIGIPKDAQESIFEAFRQVEGTRMAGGSGLGLAIVKQLTTLMKGKVELQSEMGAGSVFTIILPLLVPEIAEKVPQ